MIIPMEVLQKHFNLKLNPQMNKIINFFFFFKLPETASDSKSSAACVKVCKLSTDGLSNVRLQ